MSFRIFKFVSIHHRFAKVNYFNFVNYRSTKSEKMYPALLTRGSDVEIEPYYCLPVGSVPGALAGNNNVVPVAWSQPTSPTPPSRFSGGPLSPTHVAYRLTYPKKNDDGKNYLRFETGKICIASN